MDWISVDCRLPQKSGKYLVAIKTGSEYVVSTRKFKICEEQYWFSGGYWERRTGGVRYWAELPEPPKE